MSTLTPHAIEIILLVAILILVILIHNAKIIIQPALKAWSVNSVFFINHSLKLKGEITMVQAKVDQKFKASWPAPQDKYGNETTIHEGSKQWVSDDESVATVEDDPEAGLYACKIKTHGKVGATAIRLKGDADLGDGVTSIEGVLAVEVVAGTATAFGEPTTTTPEDDDDEN